MDETASVRASLDWLQEIFTNWVRWVREHLLITLLLSAAAFAVGWVWNTYVMAVGLQGSVVPPEQRTIATAEGRTFNALFWLLFFSLLAGLATYGWQRGWRQMWQDLGVLPRRFVESIAADKNATAGLLLWGFAVALVTATVITSAVSLALGLVLVTLAATPVGVIINFAVIRLWRGLTGVATPEVKADAAVVAGPFLVMVGEALGLFVDWGANSWLFSLVVGILAAGGALLIARRGQAVVAGTFVLGMVWLVDVVHSRRAWADDGGWDECITDSGEFCRDAGLGGLLAWFGSDGASTVMAYASIGAVFSGIGTALGLGLGAAAAVGVAGSAAAPTTGAGASAAGDRSTSADLAGTSGTAADQGRADRVGAEDVPGDLSGEAGVAPEAGLAAGGGTAGSGAELPDVLPEPPEGSKVVEPADSRREATASSLESSEAPLSPTGQGPPSFDIHDVLPEPPDREEEETDTAARAGASQERADRVGAEDVAGNLGGAAGVAPEAGFASSDEAVGSDAELPDALPEPPEGSKAVEPTESPGEAPASSLESSEAPLSPTCQGPPSFETHDVLPEPPDREDEESEKE